MKRLILVTILLFLPFSWLLMAQPSFAVKKVFDGKVLNRNAVVETVISGGQLSAYHLDSFHSLKFSAGSDQARAVEDLVLADAGRAHEKETVLVDGKLVYAVLAFMTESSWNEYICFQSDGTTATLVYMAGSATLEDLKSIFATKE